MNAMSYKGYGAAVDFDAEDLIFAGRIVGIDDIVTFHGKTVDELENAFRRSVDHYLETNERLGRKRPIQPMIRP